MPLIAATTIATRNVNPKLLILKNKSPSELKSYTFCRNSTNSSKMVVFSFKHLKEKTYSLYYDDKNMLFFLHQHKVQTIYQFLYTDWA